MKCTNCGAEIGDAKFCTECGTPSINPEQVTVSTQETARTTDITETTETIETPVTGATPIEEIIQPIAETSKETIKESVTGATENNTYNSQNVYNSAGDAGQAYSNQSVGDAGQTFSDKKGQPYVQKSKMVAGLLGIFLGAFGVHNFYLGYTQRAIIQASVSTVCVLLSCCTLGISAIGTLGIGIWGLVEGIMILTGSINVDGNGNPLKD